MYQAELEAAKAETSDLRCSASRAEGLVDYLKAQITSLQSDVKVLQEDIKTKDSSLVSIQVNSFLSFSDARG